MKVTLYDLLIRSGLGSNESKIYVYLHEYGEATASQIAKTTHVPRSKTYEYLDSLVARGLALRVPSKPIKFRASSVSVIKNAIAAENRTLASLKDRPSEYFPIYLTIGQANVMRQFSSETNKAKHEIISIVRGLKGYPLGLNSARRAMQRGVKMRILALDRPDVRKIVPLWKKAGVAVRLYRATEPQGLRLTVFDNKLARLTIGRPEIVESENYTTVWIKSKAVAAMCTAYFEQKWRESAKL